MHRKQFIVETTFGMGACLTLWLAALPQNGRAQEEHGAKVGQKAPALTLKDQHGNDRSLAEFLKKGPVALVFYRSADW